MAFFEGLVGHFGNIFHSLGVTKSQKEGGQESWREKRETRNEVPGELVRTAEMKGLVGGGSGRIMWTATQQKGESNLSREIDSNCD